MIDVIKEKLDLCVGCNRCVRECSMEMANITYQDESGNIKVKIDHEKCITCGLCVSACKHDARSFSDDTERFFNDLSNGMPISFMAAPSIRTNMPDYKKLFTYLKQLGVNKILDVSLGADICVWAHVRYIKENNALPLITQPCPVIVTYCEFYNHDLLKRLSPIQSPMACTSIYMKKYQGIKDRIAVLSPCMAKANEFESTKLADYNITFTKLLEYLKKNEIMLPDEETEFDYAEGGLGSLFPMPGGFKENIEYLMGKNLHVAKAEGENVFEKLDKYAKTPVEFLPDIYDVLCCAEGCNIGTASLRDKCLFAIEKTMKNNERKVKDESKKKHYESVYKEYDETLDLSCFIREYNAVYKSSPKLTDADIGKAFELLGKNIYEKQHVDCFACGSKTCHDMARKIALNINIPSNCIVKAMEDSKAEHEENLRAHAQRMEAETANKAKSVFLSHISHEIRTPMNAVIGTAEIQLQKEGNPADIEEAFNTIYNSGNLLLNIINDILDLSKIEAGKLDIIPAQYDIPSILYDTVQLNLLRYDSKPIEFDLEIDQNTPIDMIGDELRIKQILNNILSNAFKYTDAGKVKLSVSAETTDEEITDPQARVNCVLILSVTDTGQGMTEEQIVKLFEEYTRFNTDTNRTIVGTGLGMHITKRLIDAMNGEILVESKVGTGSIFTVRLPQVRIGAGICGSELAKKLKNSRFKSTLKMNRSQIVHEYMPYGSVLVVDDIESNLYVAKGMMVPYGLKIETVSSGFDCIDKVKDGKKYDIIFMDHMMPKMNGMETTKKIQEMGYNNPIIALTANAVAGSSDMFLANGFDGFLSKPIDLRELNSLLNKFIRDKYPPEVIEEARQQMIRQKKQTRSADNTQIKMNFVKAIEQDIKNAIVVLENILPKINNCSDADINLFTTTVHGMKSVLMNIDEKEQSAVALKLEHAGRKGNINEISIETPLFINELKLILDKHTQKYADIIDNVYDDIVLLNEKLFEIKTACGRLQRKIVKAILEDLRKKSWSQETIKLLDEISLYLLHGEFKKIIAAVEEAINKL